MGRPDLGQEPELSPGVAFHLMADGSWKPEKLPDEVLHSAWFSGYLTVQGYRCSVFETPDKEQWAQKSVNTPATASAFGKVSGSMSTVASRVAAAWLSMQAAPQHQCASCASFAWHGPEQSPVRFAGGDHHPACPELRTAKADDVVSQVQEILNGESNGPFGHDDVKFDEEILEYCEEVRAVLPKMQEIFDAAFHEAMDLKSELPETENPRIRQLAQEKVSEMLSQAAARLEIISHGLLKEVEELCGALEAGASRGAKKEASSPAAVAAELAAIAAAIDASESPDPELVALDLREVLASLDGP